MLCVRVCVCGCEMLLKYYNFIYCTNKKKYNYGCALLYCAASTKVLSINEMEEQKDNHKLKYFRLNVYRSINTCFDSILK